MKYARKELFLRLLWGLITPFFRWSPRVCWGWRRWLLRCFGAKVGTQSHIYPSVRIFAPWQFQIGSDSSIGYDSIVYNLGPVSLGDRVTVSQRAHLCAGTHDYRDPVFPLIKSPIQIKDEVWVCADAFIGPGVTIGRNAIVAARAVVVKDVSPHDRVAGNPAGSIATESHGTPE